MKSTSETGHVKNVANFEDLISFCTAYGESYNPTKTSITIAALEQKFEEAQIRIAKVTTAKNEFDNVIGIRQTLFAPLKPLATRVVNALSATDALQTVVKDAKTINRKLQGTKAPSTTSKNKEPNPEETIPATISTSQQSYDRLMDNFSQLIDLVKAETNYSPNETELKVEKLIVKHSELKMANTAVITKYAIYSNSRLDRNATLYNAANNLIETALDVKKYVKSVFGATSPQYKQISGLRFTKPKL
jgi:hypothetical protein